MVAALIRSALAAAVLVSIALPACAESVVTGGVRAPAPGGGFRAAGLLGRVDNDVDTRSGPANAQFLSANSHNSGRSGFRGPGGRFDNDVDSGGAAHHPGQFKNPPVTPPVGSETPPLPGSRSAPEPASISLLGLGAISCVVAGGLRRRRLKRRGAETA